MRQIFKSTSIILGSAALLAFTSCSDKDKNEPLPDLSVSHTYTGNNLELYYNGELMPGKSAEVSVNNGMATMKFSQSFDLSQLSGLGLTGSIAGPGITPGDAVLEITAPVSDSDGKYNVAGKQSTEYVDFSYSGSISSDKMTFSIADATLKSQMLAGNVLAPAPLEKDGLTGYKSMPFHLVWELDPVSGIDIPLSEILQVVATAPVIPVYNGTAYSSVAQLFESVVKTIALTGSGNVAVVYVSTLGGAAHLATSSGNMIQYIPQAGGLKLYLNPLSVAAQVMLITSDNKNDDKFDFNKLLNKAPRAEASTDDASTLPAASDGEVMKVMASILLKAFAPQLSGGIPMSIIMEGENVDIYFDTATSVTFLATVLNDALQNPEVLKALHQALASANIPELNPEDIAGILQQLPGFLISTTRLEIGLSMVKGK